MAKLTEEQVAKLKSVHPVLIALETKSGHQLVFRKPKRIEFDQYFDKRAKDEGSVSQHALSFAQQCLVYPTPQEFLAVLEETPFLLMCAKGVIDSLTDLSGSPEEVAEVKKL